MTIELRLEKVLEGARRFYLEGRLTAQHPDPRRRRCVYRDGEYRCAIGAGLTEAEADALNAIRIGPGQIDETYSVSVLSNDGHVTFVDEEEAAAICRIQHAHDRWCNSAAAEADIWSANMSQGVDRRRRHFAELIGIEAEADDDQS